MKTNMKRVSIFLFFLVIVLGFVHCAHAAGEETIRLNDGWKFMPGDNPDYAAPAYDDSKWTPIRVDKTWEDQGYEKLDGFAWFRLKIVLPSALKEKAYLKDGLRIFLGKINNFDQSFLNGSIFGINGKPVPANTPMDNEYTKADMQLWNHERCYILPIDDPRIRWDRENVIAVRVFDEGGLGGLFSGDANIRMITFPDYLVFDNLSRPFFFKAGETGKTFSLSNTSSVRHLQGTLTISAKNKLTGQEVYKKTAAVEIAPGTSREFSLVFPDQDQSCLVRCVYEFKETKEVASLHEESPYILTPKPGEIPKINGAKVVGARPGRPFLFTVPTTGLRPMTFDAKNLPDGLIIDKNSGIITGRVTQPGEYTVTLSAKNNRGLAEDNLKIVIGNQIALTPPMGWNSWNCWGLSVDQEKILASARVFKEKGLMDHGWTYINIDDGWEIKGDSPLPKRDPRGNILTNEKFKDMKGLGDSIHALGLKFGIYSSPGPLTCGGYTATYQYELQDAGSFADWGIDYLKYDWCSYEKIAKDQSRPELMKPYQVMRKALDELDRDIVYSLCQYGMGKVWEWGAEVGGNLWRTTGDIADTWESMRDIGFNQVDNAAYAGPGHWNDPDMLVIGRVGWGPNLHPTRLTPDEQYTHISLWSLLSAPLLIGCDLERLDDFSLNLLTNDEVLALDQDPLGKQALPVIKKDSAQVWVKDLADGDKAVGIFNLGEKTEQFTLDLQQLGLTGPVAVRDLWRQENLGKKSSPVDFLIPAHGVILIRLND
jgi:alpha-galactosidase